MERVRGLRKLGWRSPLAGEAWPLSPDNAGCQAPFADILDVKRALYRRVGQTMRKAL